MKKLTNALEIYKLPFHVSGPYIFSSNGVMALTSVNDDCEFMERVCCELNEEYLGLARWENVESKGQYILADGKPILIIRGWGHLTGCGALNLPSEEAAKIQDDFRDWIISKLRRIIQ